MLSCLVPPRFGQEDKIMPAPAAFALQFPSLASSLHHHNVSKDDDNQQTAHSDYCIKCPQCHQRLSSFQALRQHLEVEHPTEIQNFNGASVYHTNGYGLNNNTSSSNSGNSSNTNHQINLGPPSPPASTSPSLPDFKASSHLNSHHQNQEIQHRMQQHRQAMAIAMAGMARTSPQTSVSLNGYDECGRSTSSPSSSTTLGDICGALSNTMVASGGSYACAQCTASFPTRELLEKHELMHSPNTTVSCKICHKTFANVYRLQRHMISHDESSLLRKFKCNECDKAFKFKHHLKEHVRIHSGEKPFSCNNCGKRFSHSGSYSSHMTSKKCISMGLKLNNNRSLMKSIEKVGGSIGPLGSPNSKRVGLNTSAMGYFPPGLQNVGLPGAINNNNPSTTSNNNTFYPILPKYNNYNYDVMLLASMQNSLYGMAALDPRIHPYSIQRLLELTAAGNPHNMDLLKNNINLENGSTETPSLHSDPEDMIEEITEDVSDEPKLVMDIDEEEKVDMTEVKCKQDLAMHENQSETAEDNEDASDNSNNVAIKIKEEVEDDNAQTLEDKASNKSPAQLSENEETEEPKEQLQCSRCDKVFNHQTELVQHEKILCGLINQNSRTPQHRQETEFGGSLSYIQSGSEEDAEDRDSKAGSESERKVRVRTAITEEQQTILKEHYSMNPRPSREEFRIIANRLNLDARVVQVWFQNNRSRERKLNSFNLVNKSFTSPLLAQSVSPSYSPCVTEGSVNEEQPLDLSVKKENVPMGTPLKMDSELLIKDEAINLSRKPEQNPNLYRPFPYYTPSLQSPQMTEGLPRQYVLPEARSLVPMECLLQMNMPEYARSQLLGFKVKDRDTSLSPNSEKRSWRDDDSRISRDDDFTMLRCTNRIKKETVVPDVECPFVCNQCDKAFSKQSSLARHKYEHSGQRPYKCEECPKAFKHKHHLTEHKRLHSGEKPFQCTKCLKRFSHSGSFSQHMNHRYSYCKPYRE